MIHCRPAAGSLVMAYAVREPARGRPAPPSSKGESETAMNSFTTLLYARPSFLEGMGRLLDFGNHLNEYNSSLSPEQADALALYADWTQIGDDLRLVLEEEASTIGADASNDVNTNTPVITRVGV